MQYIIKKRVSLRKNWKTCFCFRFLVWQKKLQFFATLLVHFTLPIINIMLHETGDQIKLLKRLLKSFREHINFIIYAKLQKTRGD